MSIGHPNYQDLSSSVDSLVVSCTLGMTIESTTAPRGTVGVFGTGDPSDIPGRDFGNGSFFRNKSVGLRDYLDGTSNTIAVGERSQNLSRATWSGAITQAAVPITLRRPVALFQALATRPGGEMISDGSH